jgi:hypothetical protein
MAGPVRPFDAAFLSDTNHVVLVAGTRNHPHTVLRSIAAVVGDLGLDVHLYQSILARTSRGRPSRRVSRPHSSGCSALSDCCCLRSACPTCCHTPLFGAPPRSAGAWRPERTAPPFLRPVIAEGVVLTFEGVVAGLFVTSALTHGAGRFSGWHRRHVVPRRAAVRFLSAGVAWPDVKGVTVFGCVMVALTFASWNQLEGWLRQVDGLRLAA